MDCENRIKRDVLSSPLDIAGKNVAWEEHSLFYCIACALFVGQLIGLLAVGKDFPLPNAFDVNLIVISVAAAVALVSTFAYFRFINPFYAFFKNLKITSIIVFLSLGFSQIYFVNILAPSDVSMHESTTDEVKIFGKIVSRLEAVKNGELQFLLSGNLADKATGEGEVSTFLCRARDLPWGNISTVHRGSLVVVNANIQPMNIDYRSRRYVRRGVKYNCTVNFISNSFSKNKSFVYEVRSLLQKKINRTVRNTKVAGIMSALLLGDRAKISYDTNDLIKQFGIAHVFVVSGLHVGLLFSIFYFFIQAAFALLFVPLGKYNYPNIAAHLIGNAVILLYIVMLGFSMSAVRAGIVIAIISISKLLSSSRISFVRSMVLSAFILCSIWPGVLEEVGFQLTYLALAGIFCAQKILISRQFAKGEAEQAWLKQCQSKAASMILFAIIPSFFTNLYLYLVLDQWAPFAAFGNIVLVPLIISVGFFGGIVSLAVSTVIQDVGRMLMVGIEQSLDQVVFLLEILHYTTSDERALFYLLSISPYVVVLLLLRKDIVSVMRSFFRLGTKRYVFLKTAR